jgi:excisionase family DNA binding protein
MPDKILTAPDMAKFFGVSKKTIYEWCKAGALPAFKIGQEWMVRQSDLQKMITGKLSKGRSRGAASGKGNFLL